MANPSTGGVVSLVLPGSSAEAAGLQIGDAVLSINGHALRDVIDYHFYGAEEELDISVRRGNGQPFTVRIHRQYGEDLGLEFATPTFDGIRHCTNHCDFCFVQQMPKGLRKTLYVKDDDYRYSFLLGNFVTLTNLDQEDWARLEEQRLSPLYVSVHATDPELRNRILGTSSAPDILEQLQRLGQIGIEVHTQIVVVPDLNDGQNLERTVLDLADLYPTVASIAMVPVGLTRYQSCGFRSLTPQDATAILAFAKSVQPGFRRSTGVGLLYPSDEFYLLAGRNVPSARSYDGYPQLANGVGLVRLLLEDWRREKRRECLGRSGPTASGRCTQVTLVCGTLIAPILRPLADEIAQMLNVKVQVVPVVNHFFGSTVTVSGLLTAQDVTVALLGTPSRRLSYSASIPPGRGSSGGGLDLGDLLVLPRAMFDDAGNSTLDDYSPSDMERELGVPVAVAGALSEVVQALQQS